ncbi:MAG: hypothetical protein CFE26_14135 [Verrucomicrobiales bacterium VVV1]|nr:MAG: hypothetical protein CFE26_14135 [Verrucomicrobiales bacterium VVV1]
MLPESRSIRSTWIKDVLLLTLFVGIWLCAFLGFRPLANPDEGRYAEIPREMAASGDFVTPRLNGVKYFEKPPLLYWLSALTFKVFGVNQFTARIWNGLFAMLGVLMTYVAARVLYGRSAGVWSAIVLSTSLLYYGLTHIVLLDMAVAVEMAGALFSFMLAMREPAGRKRFGYFVSFYLFMALATLTKGLIGFMLPGAVAFLWLLVMNRWRSLWPFYPIVGIVLFLGITAPWHILAAVANPSADGSVWPGYARGLELHKLNQNTGWTWFYFVNEHFLRFTTKEHGRYEPAWFFLPVLVGGFFPWTLFGWQAVKTALHGGWKARREHAEAWFMVIWIAFIVLFFSKSQSKLIPYILPVFPAMAVLVGNHLVEAFQTGGLKRGRAAAWSFIGLLILFAAAVIFMKAPKGQPDFAAQLPVLKPLLVGVLLLGAGVTAFALRREQASRVIACIAGSTILLLLTLTYAAQELDHSSSKDFATILEPRIKPEDRLYTLGIYPQDLPVYLNRTVSVVEYEGEMQFGIEVEPSVSSGRFLKRDDFFKQWALPGTTYALMRTWYYDKWFSGTAGPHQVIGKSEKFILVVKSNSNS